MVQRNAAIQVARMRDITTESQRLGELKHRSAVFPVARALP